MWHMTHDMWHATCDTWHVTCDTWNMTGGGRWTFSQNFSFPFLTVWEWRYFEDFEEKGDSPNQSVSESMNDKGVCRTAPATPGLLITLYGCSEIKKLKLTQKLHKQIMKKGSNTRVFWNSVPIGFNMIFLQI